MTPNEIRERVARAICTGCDENPDHRGDARGNDYRWQDYLEPADAALDAVGLGYGEKDVDELKVALRVATIIIEDRVQIPNDAPFMEKARELVGYKKAEQMSIDEVMDSLFAV